MSAPGRVVGIDASRNRSGGAKGHLIGILSAGDPRERGIRQIHVWAYQALLDALPNAEWLVKHSPPALTASLPRQAWWQFRHLPREARAVGCEVMLNTDAGSVCHFQPSVSMSRDMLSYEPGEMRRYRMTRSWVRLFLLRYIQAYTLRRATGAVFLTQYAATTIQRVSGKLRCVAIIPHGVGAAFKAVRARKPEPEQSKPIRAVYVSNADLYKHQWHVVRACAMLRDRGHDIVLELVGGGDGVAQERLDREIVSADPKGEFVSLTGAVPARDLPSHLANADVFIFASSCENMPNTLLEGMAAGCVIACSNRGPMPEVLGDGGVYFDPERPQNIADAIEPLLTDAAQRHRLAARAAELADQYSWDRCARETWDFMVKTADANGRRPHSTSQNASQLSA